LHTEYTKRIEGVVEEAKKRLESGEEDRKSIGKLESRKISSSKVFRLSKVVPADVKVD